MMFGVILFAVLFVADTSAQTRRRGVNGRERNQVGRIKNGVQSGELTRRETARLVGEQAHIRAMEFRFRHSGDGLSSRERYRLERELNQSSRKIYRQKHDGQDRPVYRKY